MKIWVDADACPVVIKEILYRAANRTKILTTFIANQYLAIPPSPYLAFSQVAAGFDVADDEIIKRMQPGDLVITADIPLAAEVIDHQGTALNPRGEIYTLENIRVRLNMRDFMHSLRSAGIDTGGSPAFNQANRQNFANNLDKFLLKNQHK